MTEYSEDFDTDALIKFLEDLRGRVLNILRQEKINGRSFLTLTDEELKKLGMKDDDREELLMKIDEVKETKKAKLEDGYCVIEKEPKGDARPENPLKSCFYPDLTKKEMTISFQTILPASLWGWDGKNCELFISFEAPELGGWKSLLTPFETTGATSDGNVILQGQLQLEIKIIKQHNYRFAYKYVVFTSISQKSFEHISHSSLLPGVKYVNRLLSIPENAVSQGGVFRCYDVLIYPDKKVLDLVAQNNQSILCNVRDYFLKKYPDVPVEMQSIQPDDSNLRFVSLQTHLLQYQKILSNTSFTIHSSTVAQLYRTIVSIYNQICERRVQVVYPWKKDTSKNQLDGAKQWMVDWFFETSTMTLNNLQKEESSHSKYTYVISGAILLVAIHELMLMKLMSTDELLCVSNLLYIQPSVREDGSKFCPSFDALMKCLVDDAKDKLKNAIIKICHLIISQTKGKNIDWLSLLPLHHFLTFDKKPFMEPPTNHKNIKWTFWEDLTANRSGFQEFVNQSKQYSSFEALWDNCEHLFSLDPVLMKVLMYMCPQNELVHVLQRAPPILGISYLINIWSKKKSIKDDEVHELVNWFKGIQVSIIHLDANSWDKIGDELFEATVSLTEVITNKISYSKNNLDILKKMFEFHLFVTSELIDHRKGKNLILYLDRIDDLLYQWINHHNVIGNSIGGVNARKLKEEIELWKLLFEEVKCHENISTLWKDKLKEIIERRAEQVPDEEKLTVFMNSHLEDECPQEISDVFIQMGMKGLSSLMEKDTQSALQSLDSASAVKNVKTVGKLLSRFIKTSKKGLHRNEITIDELLGWEIWPHFVRIACQQDPVFKEMEGVSVDIINAAVEKVIELQKSIFTGDISRRDLLKIMEKEKIMQQLLLSANLTHDLNMYQERLDAFNNHVNAVTTMLLNIDLEIEGHGQIEKDVTYATDKSRLMKEICLNWNESKDKNLIFQLLHDSPLYCILHPFSIMMTECRCVIFRKILENCQNEHKHKFTGVITQQQFVDEVWKGCINKCYTLLTTCVDGSASALELDELFPDKQFGHVLNYDEIQFNLEALHDDLQLSFPDRPLPAPPDDKWALGVSEKIKSFRFSKDCCKIAHDLLQLKDQLNDEGNHELLQNLAKKDNLKYQLKDINEDFIKTENLLREVYKVDRQECLKSLLESWDIVKWIATTFKDNDGLQAFVNVAYTTTHADDDLNIQKLNALRIVGNAVADFLPILSGKVNRKHSFIETLEKPKCDESSHLIGHCQGLWNCLEQNKHLPSLLRECNKNIEWFTNIKQSHGTVHITTIKELELIMQDGFFIIGDECRIIHSQMADVIYLLVISKDTNNTNITTDVLYDLEKLQDLESRLVLITGQSTKEVQTFLNVFHTICIIADMLINLHEQGCIQYIGWQYHFHCGSGQLSQLKEEQKFMSQQLQLWSEAVTAARDKCYALNSYTMKQILLLRKELQPRFTTTGDIEFDLIPQSLFLLKCIHPCVATETMLLKLKESWNDLEAKSEMNPQPKRGPIITSSPQLFTKNPRELLNDITSIFTKSERSTYIRLTERQGHDKLWVMSEILKRGIRTDIEDPRNNCKLMEIELELSDEVPADSELLESIKGCLLKLGEDKLAKTLEPQKISEDKVKTKEISAVFQDVGLRASFVDMLDIRTNEYMSMNKLMMLLTVFNNKIHQVACFLQKDCILTGIDIEVGSPNLYITESFKVLQTVLTIYTKDTALPLPTQEEVLICDEQTTTEEVILLWRRAIFDPGYKRIFCLVYGEKLSYSTCERALKELNRLKQGKSDYRLVIICNSESSVKSHLMTALHSYKRTNPKIDEEALQEYLKEHLVDPDHINIGTSKCILEHPAYSVDPQRSYVRIITSCLPGMGKSLYVQRMGENLAQVISGKETVLRIPIHGPVIKNDKILEKLCHLSLADCKIIHFDIAPSMIGVVESFLFSILVLGHLRDHKGNTWRREIGHMYAIEVTLPEETKENFNNNATCQLLYLFPSVHCKPPEQENTSYKQTGERYFVGMDINKLKSEPFQRVYHYLQLFSDEKSLDNYTYSTSDVVNDASSFIRTVMRQNTTAKSWSEIDRYVNFLNVQLLASETSDFFNTAIMGSDWSGFKTFVVKMMVSMSKEFTTSSLMDQQDESELQKYEIKHIWNESFHPYLFFNKDQTSITPMGFCINDKGDAIDPNSRKIILPQVINQELNKLLSDQNVALSDNYLNWNKDTLLVKLATVIGLKKNQIGDIKDPDPSYVITVDNVMKMMAILMRFRCGIPVVIMGETGCGKTRLLRYLCQLASHDELESGDKANLVILKVHGGTTEQDIEKAVDIAECIAEGTTINRKSDESPIFGTVLFFDEANTTEHINLIKEIMCDRTIFGRKIHQDLRIAAACNPYRMHTNQMIKKLESAGLGFYTKSAQTKQRLGSIPLRHLVYRVHDLPSSMASLIFDFGRLDSNTEKRYIEKMVENKLSSVKFPESSNRDRFIEVISKVLAWSQDFMRDKKNECSFVSLRDVDRAMIIFKFFFELLTTSPLSTLIDDKGKHLNHKTVPVKCKYTRALILTLGVCYYARLEQRDDYIKSLLQVIAKPLVHIDTPSVFTNELICCQDVLLDNMKLEKNIARNSALCENVFMMLVCTSLRIPLFLVGKPGSSKSLAKSIILNSMKGPRSEMELLQKLKEVQLFPYQCSQLSTSDSILNLFKQASKVQDKNDKSQFVSVVVLDEVGLAEDSPNLPLKVLHPLLEDGTEGNSYSVDIVERKEREIVESEETDIVEYKERVAFIGISNWALDPAKMNRGIMVTRCSPSLKELELTALQICSDEETETNSNPLKLLFPKLARAYLAIIEEQNNEREYYGLRDFYSLVKMLFWMCKITKQPPNRPQIKHAILRNFSGVDKINTVKYFEDEIQYGSNPDEKTHYEWCRKCLKNEFKQLKQVKNAFYDLYKEKHVRKLTEDFAKIPECQKPDSDQQFERYQKRQFGKCLEKNDFEDGEINTKFEAEYHEYFEKRFKTELWPFVINPDNSPSGLIHASLANRERTMHGESRYLLFLTENYAALQTLQHFLEAPALLSRQSNDSHKSPYILFGSSFPKDKTFTQVYRNINTIKVCMETGRTVILLNLDHLYESLYDALNQYYVYFGNMRFVDLGLQNHRVKCSVHDNFKLILIAEKEKVYNEFPTPLINRLEKHYVVTSTILTEEQKKVEIKLKKWIKFFCSETKTGGQSFQPADSFIGYQDDTPAAAVFKASKKLKNINEGYMIKKCQFLLVQILSPDAIVRLKTNKILRDEFEYIARLYTEEQHHTSLKDFLCHQIHSSDNSQGCRMQVTTCNELLSNDESSEIKQHLNLSGDIEACILQEFDTEFDFSRKIREFFQNNIGKSSLLIIQCDSGHLNGDLIACAKYRVDDIWQDIHEDNDDCSNKEDTYHHVLFTVLIPREHSKSSFVGFLGGDWVCAHIDEFCPVHDYSIITLALSDTPLSSLFCDPNHCTMQVDDDFESSSPHNKQSDVPYNQCQFLYKNIQPALQKATSDSKSEIAHRTHELNDILYQLLKVQKPLACNFHKQTVLYIWEVLKECEIQEKELVFVAASNVKELQEGGAFLQVLLRRLNPIVEEVLAKIIKIIDQNYNLSLIDPNNDPVDYVRHFWMTAYINPLVIDFKASLKSHDQKQYSYHCQFPFSRVIQDAVQVLIKEHQAIKTNDDGILTMHFLQNVKQSKIGELLNEIPDHCREDMITRYTNDLIQLNWTGTFTETNTSHKELKIISETVISKAKMLLHQNATDFTDLICGIHEALDMKRSEIFHFKELVSHFPNIVYDNLLSNLPLNVTAAITVISLDLIDSEDDTDTTVKDGIQRTVISKLHQYYQISNFIDTALYSVDDEALLQPRLKWQGIQAVHLFIEHVMMDHVNYLNKTLQYLDRIRMFVVDPRDFTKRDTLTKLEQRLSKIYENFSVGQVTGSFHSQAATSFAQSCIRFYVAIVSNLCLKNPPEDELIEKLLETAFTVGPYTQGEEIRDLTPFLRSTKNNVPVIRSFLLQILLYKNYEITRKHVKKYFESTLLASDENKEILVQLQLLYSQLYENSLHDSVNVSQLTQLMNESKRHLLSDIGPVTTLEYLESVGGIRFVLLYVVEQLVTRFHQQGDSHSDFEQLLCSVEDLCRNKVVNTLSYGPQTFLLKSLFRRCGEIDFHKITSKRDMNWILPIGTTSNTDSIRLVDYFAIHGAKYIQMKQSVLTKIKSLQVTDLKMQEEVASVMLAISFFMEITQTYSKPTGDKDRIPNFIIQAFVRITRETKKIRPQMRQLIIAVLDNNYHGNGVVEQLKVQPQQSLEDKLYSSIVVHVAAVFTGKEDNSLTQLFHIIMTNPGILKDAHLPMMPENIGENACQILGGQLYQCPKGHPYLVTECGLPMEVKNCPECGKAGSSVKIGGTDHKLRSDNKQLERGTRPQKGYTLGYPVDAPAIPERSLSPAAGTIIKVLMHSVLLWTCCTKQELVKDICSIVKTGVEAPELPIFFWKHLVMDLKCLQTVLSMGLDDVALLIHIVMADIVKTPSTGQAAALNPAFRTLATSQIRYEWEEKFNETYIQPILKNVHKRLEESRQLILQDEQQNHPPLLDVVYERNIDNPNFHHHLWKYRPTITLEHLCQQIEVGGYSLKYPALSYFLREEASLRATKFLPAIYQIQCHFHDIHHYRSSQDEVKGKTIGQFLDSITNDEEKQLYESMIDKVRQAWLLVRGKLQTHGRLPVLQEYIKTEFSRDTPLVYLIPKTSGPGVCTTSLVDHLVMIHNEFIDICLRIVREMHATGKTWKSVWKDPSVRLKDIHESQLLNYEGKLMAVILVHCHYSLTVGQDQPELQYDFAGLEKHLLNDFVYGKPHIQLEIPHVVYRKDVYTGEKFEMIAVKIKPQIPLSAEARRDILKRLNQIHKLRQALDHIDIVMGFLSAGGNEDGHMSLMQYATKVLKISDFNEVVGQGHCLGHVHALWDVVSLELAKKITITGQLPFKVHECFCKRLQLSEQQSKKMDRDLEHVNLDIVLSALNEFIEIHVRNGNTNEEKWTIKECLDGHYGVLPDELENEVNFLGHIPMSCVIEVWKKIVFYQNEYERKAGANK